MTATQIRKLLTAGQQVSVTNHYITREDHPCYGTNTRTIARVTSSHLHFTTNGNVPWPKAAQLRFEDGAIVLYGGGAGQQPGDRFLTIRPVGDDGDGIVRCAACWTALEPDGGCAQCRERPEPGA